MNPLIPANLKPAAIRCVLAAAAALSWEWWPLAASAAPTVLASSLNSPGNIIIDNSSVYWVDGADQIGSISKTPGGGAVIHYSGTVDPGNNDIVQDNVYLYYVGDTGANSDQSICEVPKTGGSPSTTISPSDANYGGGFEAVSTSALAIGPVGGVLYYGSTNENVPNDIEDIFQDIVSLPTLGGSDAVLTYPAGNLLPGGPDPYISGDYIGLAALQYDQLNYFAGGTPLSLSTDYTNVYWSDGSNIWEMPLVGGIVSAVVTGRTNIHVIATPATGAAAGSIFWVEGNIGTAKLMRREVGGQIITLLSGITSAGFRCFAIYDSTVYCEKTGSLVQVSINGGKTAVLANPLQSGGPVSVAADSGFVYWSSLTGQITVSGASRAVTATGTIMRIARPGAGPPFAAESGKFTALFDNGSGYVTISLLGTGSFTGKVVINGISHTLDGILDSSGSFAGSIGNPPVDISLQINPVGGNPGYVLTGSAGGSAFTATPPAYPKGQKAAEAGKYTVLLNGAGTASGTGGQIFVTEGELSVSGSIGEFTTTGTSVNASLIPGLSGPFGVAVSGGDIFVVNGQNANGDNNSGTIGEYTTTGQTVNAALVKGLDHPAGIAISGTCLYVTNSGDLDAGFNVAGTGSIGEYSTSGKTLDAALVSGLNDPAGIAISGTDLFVTNLGVNDNDTYVPGSGTIGEYTTAGGQVSPSLITGLSYVYAIAVSGTDLFVAHAASGSVSEYSTAGAETIPSLITGLNGPLAIAVSGSNLFVANSTDADEDANSGSIDEYTIAGTPVSTPLVTGLNIPTGLAFSTPAPPPPQGAGYATLDVSTAGAVTMTGQLPDGFPFTASGVLDGGTAGNQFIVYQPLSYPSVSTHGAKGLLVGIFTFEKLSGSDFDGTLGWIKPQQSKGDYQAPINTNLDVIGSVYTPPPKGGSVLPGFTNGTLELSDTGALSLSGTTPLDQAVTLNSANVLVLTPPIQDSLKVKITAATGVFKGTFVYPGQTKPAGFAGVLYQDQIIGGGFFVGPAGSGAVSLAPP